MSEENCATCQYFRKEDSRYEWDIKGKCHRYPPQIWVDGILDKTPSSSFPKVEGSDWCGEFNRKKK